MRSLVYLLLGVGVLFFPDHLVGESGKGRAAEAGPCRMPVEAQAKIKLAGQETFIGDSLFCEVVKRGFQSLVVHCDHRRVAARARIRRVARMPMQT